ncbi:hypothetical protein PSHT_07847 [Puccinia striiformis]|uniref:RNA helicase n=1 Tax=Puccinia striiformis TaxID=27350 RepID=A0A2S4VUK8_9BASI|nr:hypothetical protein PSHT_07847 [Puccinia striiformis]
MAFWKPGTAAPGSSLDRAADRAPALVLTAAPGLKLPILAHRRKSTQLPQFLHEAGWTADGRQVAICEPRRIAATSLASRVATEAGYVLGEEVGYAIRFEELTSKRTRIKYLTDGMLFRELMLDPLLSRYSVVVVDEAHERSCYTDLLLGVLKKIQAIRRIFELLSVRLLSMLSICATTSMINPRHKQGRIMPQLSASKAECTQWKLRTLRTYGKLYNFNCSHSHGNSFDCKEEIDEVCSQLLERSQDLRSGSLEMSIIPFHAALPPEEQLYAFQPARNRDARKVIVATNVAEASVTIEGIKYVVDSGLVKLRKFDVNQGIDVLSVCPVSKASAIQRTELTTVMLQLKALGIDNVVKGFEFLDPPSSLLVERALEFLYALGALDESGRLTNELGLKMAEMPVEPMMAKTCRKLLESEKFGCSQEIVTIAAMTSNVFVGASSEEVNQIIHHPFIATEGDHFTYLNVYNSFIKEGRSSAKWCAKHRLNFKALSRAINIRGQLVKYLKKFGVGLVSCGNDEQKVRRCLVSGYFKNVALMKDDGSYRGCRDGNVMFVHPSSVMFNRKPETGYVVYHEITETKKKLMRDLTVIDSDWLTELAGHYYQVKDKAK